MSPKQLAADIRIRLFSDRGTDLQSAMQYADQVFRSLGDGNIAAQTAMHVVLNTIANILDEMLDPADNPATGTPVQLQLDRAALDEIIDSRVEQWMDDNSARFESIVEEWFGDNVDIEHEVDEAIRNVDIEVRIR
jgi:hypothetical protein